MRRSWSGPGTRWRGGGEATPGGFFDKRGFHRRVWLERLLLESTQRETAERRTATVTVPSFGFVAPLLRGPGNLVATLPLRLAQEACATHDLVMLDLPYKRLELMTEAAWHERADRDGALMWLVRQLEEVCAALVDLPDHPPECGRHDADPGDADPRDTGGSDRVPS